MFLLSNQSVAQLVARRIGSRCLWLSIDDLYGEAMVFLCEKWERLIDHLPAYVYKALWFRLMNYTKEWDKPIRTYRKMQVYSLDRPIEPGAEMTFGDCLEAEQETLVVEESGLPVEMMDALSKLGDRQRKVVFLRLSGAGYAEIAPQVGLSPSGVQRDWNKALVLLRQELEVR